MPLFAPLDLFALAFFVLTWFGYAVLLEWTPQGARGLNARMHGYRDELDAADAPSRHADGGRPDHGARCRTVRPSSRRPR